MTRHRRRRDPVGRPIDALQEAHRRRVQEAFQRLAGLDCPPLPPSPRQAPLVSAPIVDGDRGFHLYGGRPITTDYGHTITVRESSDASEPHVWLSIGERYEVGIANPHLDLAQAIALRECLTQFIDSVPTRWVNGDQKLADATRTALGTPEEPTP